MKLKGNIYIMRDANKASAKLIGKLVHGIKDIVFVKVQQISFFQLSNSFFADTAVCKLQATFGFVEYNIT